MDGTTIAATAETPAATAETPAATAETPTATAETPAASAETPVATAETPAAPQQNPPAPKKSAGGAHQSKKAPPAAAVDAKKAEAAKADASSKRGPGRPPKRQAMPAPPRRGVAAAALDAQNQLELVYDEPGALKSLFAYFKNLRALTVHVRATPEGLTFAARDAGETCAVAATLAGRGATHFYCERVFWLALSRENVESIFASIDASFQTVSLVYRGGEPDSLVIVFRDAALDKECVHRVRVQAPGGGAEPDEALAALARPGGQPAATLEFTLSDKQFKKTVTDAASNQGGILTITKLGGAPLRLSYARDGDSYVETYNDPAKIALRAAVGPGEIFRCALQVANVRSLAAAMIAESVRVECRPAGGGVLFRSEMDALTVLTLVPN